ncbi:choice-of-anchor L domain-containing protein, partial [Bacteroidota bacterium]
MLKNLSRSQIKERYYRLQYRLLVKLILFIFLTFASNSLSAQLVINTAMTPQQLVQNILVGQGVTVSSVTFNSPSSALNIGHFSALNTNLGLDSGIIMASGSVFNAIGPNSSTSTGNATNTGSDAQLALLIPGYTIYDAAVLEFNFVPLSDTIKFRYVFGSEEYPEFVNSSFNDVFGFFISGPNPSGGFYTNHNIALIPNTTLPVCIDNVNNVTPSYPQYYVNNTGGLTLQYDGITTVLTAWAKVFPCLTYHIKLAVADAGDQVYDSGVFLEKNSFTSTVVDVRPSFSNPNLDTMAVEGCNDVIISFILSEVTQTAWVVNYSISGTATNGVDYPMITTSATIPAGSDSTGITISPYLDGLAEGIETVTLFVQTSPCGYDTITIFIRDNTAVQINACPDTMICGGFAILSVADSGGVPPYLYNWSNGDTTNPIQVSPTVATMYTVTVTDQCGSMAIDSVNVTIGGGDFADAGNDTAICIGDTAVLTASQGNSYLWSTGETTQTIYVSPLTTTQYVVTVSLACDDNDSVTVFVNSLPNVIATIAPDDICRGEIAVLNATGAKTYFWIASPSDGSLIGQENSHNPIVSPYGSTTYTVIGTDTNLCSNNASVFLHISPSPIPRIIATPNPVSAFEPIVHFIDNSQGNPVQWLWDVGDGNTYSVPSFYHEYADTGKFEVSLWVTNAIGCADSTKSYILVRPDYTLYIPNAFTPNEDDLNEGFRAYGENIDYFDMKIYDRWGNIIFESNNIYEFWDGKINGKIAPDGNYIYNIFFIDK